MPTNPPDQSARVLVEHHAGGAFVTVTCYNGDFVESFDAFDPDEVASKVDAACYEYGVDKDHIDWATL